MGTFNATQVNTGALRAAVDEFGADSVFLYTITRVVISSRAIKTEGCILS